MIEIRKTGSLSVRRSKNKIQVVRKLGKILTKKNIKKIQVIGLDIPSGYLEYLEDLLFRNGLYKENNAIYIKGQNNPIEYDIENIEYSKFLMDYRDTISIGKSTGPIKIFKTFKVVFDYFQVKKSAYRAYLIKDPSLIDETVILSKDLVDSSLLLSVLNTLDIAIGEDITELYCIHGYEVLRNSNKIPAWSLDAIELINKISEEMYALIEEHGNDLDFRDGKHYKLQLYKNMVIAEEMEDIRIVRYRNIISKSIEKIQCQNQEDDIPEEHLDMLLTIRNEDNKYKNIILSKLVYKTEQLEEFEYKLVNRTSIASLNIEIPIEGENENDG